MTHLDGGNIYGFEQPSNDPGSLADALAERYGGSVEEWNFTAQRIRNDVRRTVEGSGSVAVIDSSPNNEGLHEIKIYEGFSSTGQLITRIAFATPEQFAKGTFIVPKNGVHAKSADPTPIPDNIRHLGK